MLSFVDHYEESRVKRLVVNQLLRGLLLPDRVFLIGCAGDGILLARILT